MLFAISSGKVMIKSEIFSVWRVVTLWQNQRILQAMNSHAVVVSREQCKIETLLLQTVIGSDIWPIKQHLSDDTE